MIQGTAKGLLFRVVSEDKSVLLDAAWPGSASAKLDLTRKILVTADTGKPHLEKVARRDDAAGFIRIYHPISSPGLAQAKLVVVLEISDRNDTERKTVAKLLRWNGEWLKFSLANPAPASDIDLGPVFSIALACLDQPGFRSTAMSLVTELASSMGCQRVSLGMYKKKHIQVEVLSHSARFKHETNMIQGIGAAMEEAVDQDRVIVFPTPAGEQSAAVTHSHSELAKPTPRGTFCTVPISHADEIVGAVTLERESGLPFDPPEIMLIERLGAILAPVLLLKHQEEKSLFTKAWLSFKDSGSRVFGPAHIKLKMAVVAAAAALVFFSLADADWRVTAQAVVEGSVQRTIAAPIDGYISSAEARAGDVVRAYQELGALDDSDLRLERLKWSTLQQQMISESREAMAQHNRAEVGIINAKIEQANAELQLIDEQLSRTKLLAPFAGIIIEGDLSQSLGTPVTRGDVLFKVAPLDDYRIVLQVDEHDIAPVEPGQKGKLILASMPGRKLDLKIEKVTPVSSAENGSNFFRVEASLLDTDLQLQPGMEGVGKIEVGEAKLIWVWSRDLQNWLRLQAWTWWR
ncbi:MAG: HlyD family efflux transporter periplasmic adaptor subunit [Halioglobus sp.]